MNMLKLAVIGALAGTALLGAGLQAASASPLVVNNSDFSADGDYNQTGTGTGITGWTISPGTCYTDSNCGSWAMLPNLTGPGYSGPYTTTPGGSAYSAYVYGESASFSQDLTDGNGALGTLQANTLYTLSVAVGNNPFNTDDGSLTGNPLPITAEIDLLAGSTVIGSLTGIDPGTGNWGTYSFSVDSSTLLAYLGQDLTISLYANGGGDSLTEIDFSDVSLDASPIGDQPPADTPEPATIALLGAGLGGLALARRRKR